MTDFKKLVFILLSLFVVACSDSNEVQYKYDFTVWKKTYTACMTHPSVLPTNKQNQRCLENARLISREEILAEPVQRTRYTGHPDKWACLVTLQNSSETLWVECPVVP